MSDMHNETDWPRQFRRAAVTDLALWVVLLLLVAVSVFAAKATRTYGFEIELACAAVQVALLGAFFMQLRQARPLILLTAASATVFLLSMFVLSLDDLFTRL